MDFRLKLIVPSDPRFLSIARAAVCEASSICGLPEDLCQGITLAVDEGLANIIRHAYKGRYDQEIELNCEADTSQIMFTLLDHGEPPDPARICGQPLDGISLSGRGTHLMKAVMDEVHYERVLLGNQVRLIKRLSVVTEDLQVSGSQPR